MKLKSKNIKINQSEIMQSINQNNFEFTKMFEPINWEYLLSKQEEELSVCMSKFGTGFEKLDWNLLCENSLNVQLQADQAIPNEESSISNQTPLDSNEETFPLIDQLNWEWLCENSLEEAEDDFEDFEDTHIDEINENELDLKNSRLLTQYN